MPLYLYLSSYYSSVHPPIHFNQGSACVCVQEWMHTWPCCVLCFTDYFYLFLSIHIYLLQCPNNSFREQPWKKTSMCDHSALILLSFFSVNYLECMRYPYSELQWHFTAKWIISIALHVHILSVSALPFYTFYLYFLGKMSKFKCWEWKFCEMLGENAFKAIGSGMLTSDGLNCSCWPK